MSDLAQRIACRTGLFKEEVEEVFLALEQEVAWAHKARRPLRTGRIALGWRPGAACLRRSRSPRWEACRWMEVAGREKNKLSGNET